MKVDDAEKRLRDYLLNGIARDIFLADEAYALAEEISQHAEQLRVAGYGRLFGSLQVDLSDRQTLSIARMFDWPSSKYPTRSIRATLNFLRAHAELWTVPHWSVLHEKLIAAGTDSTSVERFSIVELTHAIVSHYESTLNNCSPALAEIRDHRDKVIAHNEAIDRSVLASPTWGTALSLEAVREGR